MDCVGCNVTTHRGVVFASYVRDMEPFQDYLGPEILQEFEATFDGRKPRLLGHYRHTLPGNWKLYHENLRILITPRCCTPSW